MEWVFVWYVGGALIAGLLYVVIAFDIVPGMREERLGRPRALPADWFEWLSGEADASGRVSETRLVARRGMLGRTSFVIQRRVRDERTDEILAVEPERRIRRPVTDPRTPAPLQTPRSTNS
ncbi:MAG: hypothetical protein IPM64_04430 [Phycisphaerales bacterium]|nr:hypothetical protein [Phycisphaerales bacterium]